MLLLIVPVLNSMKQSKTVYPTQPQMAPMGSPLVEIPCTNTP